MMSALRAPRGNPPGAGSGSALLSALRSPNDSTATVRPGGNRSRASFVLACFFCAWSVLLAAVPASAAARLDVVATHTVPAAFVRTIGGDRVSVVSLAPRGVDPHFIPAKPSRMLELHRADLLVVSGRGLETAYLPSLLAGARNPEIVPGRPGFLDLSAEIPLAALAAGSARQQTGIHPEGDPHLWVDPESGRAWARAIATRLEALDPEGAARYRENLVTFERKLDARSADWARRMAPHAGEAFASHHQGWTAFAARFRLELAGTVEPGPGIPPVPAHVEALSKTLRSRGVRTILVADHHDPRAARDVAKAAGAKVAVVPGSLSPEATADAWLAMIDSLVQAFAPEP